MNHHSRIRALFIAALACMLPASADALLFRAYVSSDGNDANACTLAAPCRLLPAALAAAADGGEIWMLDSANFNTGPVTINKSISIVALPGAVGSLVALGGPALQINTPALNVALRNIVVVPFTGATDVNGITMTGASTLTIEESVIANIPGHGVDVTGPGKLKIANTVLRNNSVAVNLRDGADGQVSSSKLLVNRFQGVVAETNNGTTTRASISDSVISGANAAADGAAAVLAVAYAGSGSARIYVTRCVIEGNAFGIVSNSNGVGSTAVSVSSSMIHNNLYGWYQQGGGSVIWTYGNNHVIDNANVMGSTTPVTMQ
jgi:hypothetical protein